MLDRSDAAALIALAHRVPDEGVCAQSRDIRALRQRAIALVNAGRVPTELQEPLMSGVGALADQTPVCLPTVPAAATSPPPSPARSRAPHGKEKGEKKHGHDHGHGRRGE
jgi:hypothetical protein